jgi:hypothetical protein
MSGFEEGQNWEILWRVGEYAKTLSKFSSVEVFGEQRICYDKILFNI